MNNMFCFAIIQIYVFISKFSVYFMAPCQLQGIKRVPYYYLRILQFSVHILHSAEGYSIAIVTFHEDIYFFFK